MHEEFENWNLKFAPYMCVKNLQYLQNHRFMMPIGFSRFRVWVHCSNFGLSSLVQKIHEIVHPRNTGCPLFFPNEDSLARRSLGTAPGQDRRGQDVVGELGPNGSGGGFKLHVPCFVDGGWLGTLKSQNHQKKTPLSCDVLFWQFGT